MMDDHMVYETANNAKWYLGTILRKLTSKKLGLPVKFRWLDVVAGLFTQDNIAEDSGSHNIIYGFIFLAR